MRFVYETLMLLGLLILCTTPTLNAQQTSTSTTTTTEATADKVAEKVEKPAVVHEPEAAPGCPIPDLRYSRPRKTVASTELPSMEVQPAGGESMPADDMAEMVAGDADGAGVMRHPSGVYDPYALPSSDHSTRRHRRHVVRPIKKRRSATQTHQSFEIGINLSALPNDTNEIGATGQRRVKRKSGKTTGALSRPKGASDSGSKSTSRKKEGATVDEEGQYIVHATDDIDEEEEEPEEEDADAVEHDHFGEVTEVRFPAEVGALGERKLCRIRCVHGKWVGPICATKAAEGATAADTTAATAAGLE